MLTRGIGVAEGHGNVLQGVLEVVAELAGAKNSEQPVPAELPEPQAYDGSFGPLGFSATEYRSEEYQGLSLDDRIQLRGFKESIERARPEDLSSTAPEGMEKAGIADLWGESTWNAQEGMARDVGLESELASLEKGDMLVVAPCSREACDWGYEFRTAAGSHSPWSPTTTTMTSSPRTS